MRNRRPILKKHIVIILGIITLIYALFMPDRAQMFSNYGNLLVQRTNLLRDTFEMAGLSGAFLNASLHFFLFYLLVVWNSNVSISGLQLSALGLFVGHSFFGTHVLSTLPIILGAFLQAKFSGYSFQRYATISIFSTAAAPIVSYFIALYTESYWYLLIALLSGVIVGFIAPVLAEEYVKFHQGFSLYNFGFTVGIVAMFVTLVFKHFNLEITPYQVTIINAEIWKQLYFLIICFVILLKVAPNLKKSFSELPKLFLHSGRAPDDFLSSFERETVLLNMALNGLAYFILINVLQIELTGPVLGGLLTIVGFSAFGKHLINSMIISLGVLLAAFISGSDLSSVSVALPILFGTALAPIAGYYGVIAGLIAGILHFNLVSVVFDLHQGMNIYNNGFSSGFVAAFVSPIMDNIFERFYNSE